MGIATFIILRWNGKSPQGSAGCEGSVQYRHYRSGQDQVRQSRVAYKRVIQKAKSLGPSHLPASQPRFVPLKAPDPRKVTDLDETHRGTSNMHVQNTIMHEIVIVIALLSWIEVCDRRFTFTDRQTSQGQNYNSRRYHLRRAFLKSSVAGS